MAFKRKRSSSRRPWKKTRSGKSSRKRGRTFQSRVRKAVLKTAETKYYDIGVENEQLYHNTGTQQLLFPGFIRSIPPFFNPWQAIGTGVARYNRIGDRITPRGIALKMYLANKADRPLTMVRVIVAILPKVIAGVVTIPRFNPFQVANGGLLGNYMLTPADKDMGVKFLYDKIVTLNNGWDYGTSASVRERTKIVRLWIKSKGNRPIVYDNGGIDINVRPLAVYCIPYEQYSTLNTDNICSMAGFMRMYYKDV